jgi:hypothetical protein
VYKVPAAFPSSPKNFAIVGDAGVLPLYVLQNLCLLSREGIQLGSYELALESRATRNVIQHLQQVQNSDTSRRREAQACRKVEMSRLKVDGC